MKQELITSGAVVFWNVVEQLLTSLTLVATKEQIKTGTTKEQASASS